MTPTTHKPGIARSMVLSDLSASLRKALDRGEFFLEYQPQFNTRNGTMRGCEALIRWRHPEKGVVLPGGFIDQAEKLGLMFRIDDWVRRTACRQAKAWQDAGFAPIVMSVNVSFNEVEEAGFVERVCSALKESGLPPEYLELELTETSIAGDLTAIRGALAVLREMGVSLAIDDFGTGYASLSQLLDLDFDFIKIDKVFIDQLDDGREELVTGIIQLAVSLGIPTIAEGVETKKQDRALDRLGCGLVQGYFYSHPHSADEFVKHYAKHLTQHAAAKRDWQRWLPVAIASLDSARTVERAIFAFQREHPDVAVSLTVCSSRDAIEYLRTGEVGLAVGLYREPLAGIEPLSAWSDDFVWVGAPESIGNMTVPDLSINHNSSAGRSGVRTHCDLENSIYHQIMSETLEAAGIDSLPYFFGDSFGSYEMALAEGFGISILPRFATRSELFASGKIIELNPAETELPPIAEKYRLGLFASPLPEGEARNAQVVLIQTISALIDSLGLRRERSGELYPTRPD